MVYLSTIKKQSNCKSKLNSSSAPVCLQNDTLLISNLRLDVFNSEVWRDFCHLGIKRCTLVRMANWPDVISINCRSNMRLERDVLKYLGRQKWGWLKSMKVHFCENGRLPSSGALYLLAHKCFTAGPRIAETCGKIAKKRHFSSFFYSPMCPSTIISTELNFL